MTGPALAGLQLAARRGGVDVEPVNVGEEPDETAGLLEDLVDDRAVVGAVVAPWTAPPEGATDALAAAAIPVVSLSWAWGTGQGTGPWRSLAADRETEATLLLEAAARSDRDGPICVGGDAEPTSRSLADLLTLLADRRAAGDVEHVGIVDPAQPATVEAVAGLLVDRRCSILLWTGGVEGADLLARTARLPVILGTSRLKNDGALELADEEHVRLETVCGCVDVTLTREEALQRFVHDFQAGSAVPPGPLAVEAYDAGRMLVQLLRAGEGTREDLAGRMGALDGFRGLVRAYRFDPDGNLASELPSPRSWRASGSRWLPLPTPG